MPIDDDMVDVMVSGYIARASFPGGTILLYAEDWDCPGTVKGFNMDFGRIFIFSRLIQLLELDC
jgi:hypothetical protein